MKVSELIALLGTMDPEAVVVMPWPTIDEDIWANHLLCAVEPGWTDKGTSPDDPPYGLTHQCDLSFSMREYRGGRKAVRLVGYDDAATDPQAEGPFVINEHTREECEAKGIRFADIGGRSFIVETYGTPPPNGTGA